VPFTFVRPVDARVLEGRPLLDLGTGDGQTLRTLVGDLREVVTVDRSTVLAPMVAADALALPFADGSFVTVLAADLIHHVGDLDALFAEVARVLRPDGVLVAWWYETAPHEAPDAPRFPRSYAEVAAHARFGDVRPLDLEITLGGGPPTVGLLGRR